MRRRWSERSQERLGRKEEKYYVLLRLDDDQQQSYAVEPEALWRSYQPGAKYTAQIRASGSIADLQKPAELPSAALPARP